MSKHTFDKPEFVRARVQTDVKNQFSSLAAARGLTPSELLRELVLREIGSDPVAEVPQLTTGITNSRLMVRLPAGVARALHIRAQMKGMASSRYLGAIAQAHLAHVPVMTGEELAALKASSRELAAIGRNINQIARALNDAHHETHRVRLELLADLADTIEAEREAIRQLMHASLASWSSEGSDNG